MAPFPEPLPTAEDRLRAALWFAQQGFGVFSAWGVKFDGTCRCGNPKCSSPGKHPIPTNGLKAATTEPSRIRAMMSVPSDPNYGLLPPEGVFVLDVDGEGLQQLDDLERQNGPLPATLRTATANGLHIFLRWPSAYPRPLGQMFGFVTRWGSGRDTGYVIGPRSIHVSGVAYAPASMAVVIAELPETWAQAVVSKPKPFIEIDEGGYQLPDPGYDGSRYKAILSYIASRYMRGISKDEIRAGVIGVLAPRFAQPLDTDDIESRFERAWKDTPEKFGHPISFEDGTPVDVAAPLPAPARWPEPPDSIVYHGIAGSIVRAVSERTEADPIGILGSLLATAGACMGHWRYIYQGSQQSANVFVVLVGETASGRKGTAQSIVRDAMTGAYPDWQNLIVSGLGSGEGLIGHLKRNEEQDHRALVLESEFGRLLTVMNREGSTLSPVVRDAWDGVPMGRFLARDSQLVTWHHVGLVAHITPIELRSKLNDVEAANGFGNRFLWLAVRRTKLVPFPESPRLVLQPYLSELSNAIRAAAAPGPELHWTPEAAVRWEQLYARLSGREGRGVAGALVARAESQIVRLALVYALLDQAKQIDVIHLAAAEALWDFSERSVGYVFGASTGNRHADMLRDFLADAPMEWEAAKRALGLRHAAELREAVDVLTGLGLVEVAAVERQAGGRPRRVLQLVESTEGQTMQTLQTLQASAQQNGSKGV